MAITITNRAKHLLIMELNNGESIYLPPDQTSNPIDEAQVDGNEKFAKLLQNSLITQAEPDAEQKTKKAKADKGSEK
jgi:hypothetical protein